VCALAGRAPTLRPVRAPLLLFSSPQAFVFGAILMGVAESAAHLFMYVSKNASGVPTPCADCGAASADFLLAVSLSVVKRAASRALLLAVALGFGVVHARLAPRTAAFVACAGLAYLAFGLADDLHAATTYDVGGPSLWALPVLAVDFVFLMGTWGGLGRQRAQLAATGQVAKALMYTRLYRVLVASLCAWTAVTLALVAVRAGALPLDPFATFLFGAFWDALYFAMLLAVAVIWAPSVASYQYSVYTQGSAVELADDDDGEIGRAHV